jgi:hypothetical protein
MSVTTATSNDNTVATLPRMVQNATERPPKKPLPLSLVFEASATAATKDRLNTDPSSMSTRWTRLVAGVLDAT